jgi:hypothetical protein
MNSASFTHGACILKGTWDSADGPEMDLLQPRPVAAAAAANCMNSLRDTSGRMIVTSD